MPNHRVCLIESLDAAGAALADARTRLQALEAAGVPARAVAVELNPEQASASEDMQGARGRVNVIRERAQLLAALEASRPDLVLVASAAFGGGTVARWLPPQMPARWWPTGFAPPDPVPTTGRPRLLPAFANGEGDAGVDPCVSAGIEWSVLEGPRSQRSRLSLWDGDFVLVPAPLSGTTGERTLRAFAAVAEWWDAMDLVVLADPQIDFAQLARGLGIGTRVHFAGPAPREAEYAWASSAAAMVLGTDGAISGGLLLRALSCGCPIVPGDLGPCGRELRLWLEQRGLIVSVPPGARGDLAFELERVLERDAAVDQAIARGQAVAAQQRVELIAPRIGAALGGESGKTAAA